MGLSGASEWWKSRYTSRTSESWAEVFKVWYEWWLWGVTNIFHGMFSKDYKGMGKGKTGLSQLMPSDLSADICRMRINKSHFVCLQISLWIRTGEKPLSYDS